MTKGNTTAVVPAAFHPPTLAAIAELKENFEGLAPEFSRVKIPAGGGLAFEIPGAEEPETAREIVGVILAHYAMRAYWPEAFTGQGTPPVCSSLDGRTGQGDPGGACTKCERAAWGTGKGDRGQACKLMHRLFVLREGQMFPLILSVPPTSVRNVGVYMTRLASAGQHFRGVMTKIKLAKDRNQDGIEYSKVDLFRVADLTPEQRTSLNELANGLMPAMRGLGIESNEYSSPATVEEGEY